MKPLYFSTLCLVAASFFSAIVLNIIPLPATLALFYPLWLPLILIYWIMVLPEHIHFTLAWILGLLIDVLYGSCLGEHSLALCVVTFFSYCFHLQFRMFPLLQQILFILLVLTSYQGVLIWIQAWLGFPVDLRWIWISLLVSALVWPLMGNVLRINPLDARH